MAKRVRGIPADGYMSKLDTDKYEVPVNVPDALLNDEDPTLDLQAIMNDDQLDPAIQQVLVDTHDQNKLPDFETLRKHYNKHDPVKKVQDKIERYKKYPLMFWRDELGIAIDKWPQDLPPKRWGELDPLPLWSKQREIVEALVKHRKVAVKSGHGLGKSMISAGITLYLAYVWHCIGLTTAPCFDKETEILTEQGWKFFRDMNGEEKVAQYHPDTEEIEFVKPLEYYKVPYHGEMIGLKTQLIDMLVTPNHRCWVSSREDKNFRIKFAEEIFGSQQYGFRISAKQNGEELNKSGIWCDVNENQWYKEDYNDFVYCVKVPTQLILVRRNGKYHVSGNTFRQVRRILWSELHDQYNKAKNPLGGKLLQTSLELGDRWFVEGFATDKPSANITGIHEENVFVIVDEAGGVDPQTFDALDAILTSRNSFVLYIGNPVEGSGPFYDAFKPDSGFYKITVSCYDSPNVKHNRIIYPKLTTPDWVRDKEKKWGRDSALFRIRVLGEFPEESKDTLIPIRYIDAALQREKPNDVIVSFGLDVGRQGTDPSIFSKRMANDKFVIIDSDLHKKVPEVAGKMIDIYRTEVPDPEEETTRLQEKAKNLGLSEKEAMLIEYTQPCINVDEIGVGGGVSDLLMEANLPVNPIDVGKPPEDDPKVQEKFLNQRAQFYWKLREVFMFKEVAIEDEELALELSKIKVQWMKNGKIKVQDKDEMKKAPPLGIGRSPNKADAMMLAYSKDPGEASRDLIRWL